MKKVELKLSQLSKGSMKERQMAQLMGGNWCYFGLENQEANEREGKCSCVCYSQDYYASEWGLKYEAGDMIHWENF